MVAISEAPHPISARDKDVYFIKSGTQEELRGYLKDFCDPLFGSDVFVSRDQGDIYYITWRDLPKERILPFGYVQISKTGPRADIYAQHSQYTDTRAMIIKKVKKDGGSVEAGIRNFDYILEGTRGRERTQTRVVAERAYEILDLFRKKRLTEITPLEFARSERETYSLLRKEGIDPDGLISKLKKRMVTTLLKGETGREAKPRPGESRERLNWLISVGALAASYRAAKERQYGLGPIAVKFTRAREALLFARDFSRSTLSDVAGKLGPLTSHVLYKFPDKRVDSNQQHYVAIRLTAMLDDLLHKLPVKPYKKAGRDAGIYFTYAMALSAEGRRREAKTYLLKASKTIIDALEQAKYVYPKEKIY